ncbi:hypothetical protein FB565_001535 [Actinoplanes lutulentus]|uniref:Uncharacterized protein n=1 Tax=Actinoplanes lutulentus TaxID=1287878 RepID=A0A327ZEH7_9ACTN|nr:hypothetical protein [Actinoplanes lutulentus]MBB2941831.1 hypothetical protein [Actinoplanes lutulentus]RAK39750.1 hypothetical protein B0I29_104288 [Actinoplanes lutulentus]
MVADGAERAQYTVTLVVDAPQDLPGYEAQFEPEGGIVRMKPGDRITVIMAGPSPPEILVHPYPGGLSIWRCMNVKKVTVTDKDGRRVDGLY